MNLEQLKVLNEKNKEKVVWTGVADRSENIPPFLDFLNQYFNLRNHKSRKEIEINLIEASKNPNLLNTMVTDSYMKLPPFVKTILLEWLKCIISPNNGIALPIVKDSIIHSILTEDDSKVINLSNLSSINPSEIGKRIATLLGTDLVSMANAEVKMKLKESFPLLLNLVGIGLEAGTINQAQMSSFIQLLFYLAVSTDGFFEESSILSILKSRAIKDPLNLQKSEEMEAKAATGYSDQEIKFHYDQKYSGVKSGLVLPLKSLNEVSNLINVVMTYILNNELAQLNNPQIYQNCSKILFEGFTNYIPASMIEDITSVIEGKPLKTSLSELSGIHLNALIIQRYLIQRTNTPNLQITFLIMAYVVLCGVYKVNPTIISNPTDLTGKFNELFMLCFGNNSMLNGFKIFSGKIQLEDIIKLDFDLNTGGYFTRTYGVMTNDNILSNQTLSIIFQRPNEFNSLGFESAMSTVFPAGVAPQTIISSLSIELMDTFFTAKNLLQFVTANTPDIKQFLEAYIKYIKRELRTRYNIPE